MELKLKMLDQTNVAEQTDKSVESIPVPPMPQPVKSSSEILCELFGAFNATPPPLDDIKIPLEPVKKIHEKKQKKHSKKKSKKVKKKKVSSKSKSRSGSEPRKKPKKSSSKHSTSDAESVISKKKRRKKLGKYSASDSDSDEDAPKSKKKKSSSEESSINCKQKNIKIKSDIDFRNTIPNLIQENVLKDAVSKIVDKVIDSTKLKKEPCDNQFGSERAASSILGNEPQVKVKQEPSSPAKEQSLENKCNKASTSGNEHVLQENIPIPDVKGTTDDPVFKDDKQTNAESEKSKPMMGKIKIQNLKFSQVYEATVKQIEEEAKRKAEKYEEGELSETTSEEKSPTPSLHSSSESVVEVILDKPVMKKRKHRHHKKEKCHHQRKRSKSTERHNSCSHHKRRSNGQKMAGGEIIKSGSQEGRKRKRRISLERSRSQSRERSSDRTKERRRSRSRERSRERRKVRRRSTVSRDRSNDRTRGGRRSRDRFKDTLKERRRSKEKSKSPEKSKNSKKEKERSLDRSNSQERNKDRRKERKKSKERASSKEKTKKISHFRDKDKIIRGTEEKIDKQKLLEIARKNALNMMKGSGGLVEQNKVVSITAGGKTVSELTDFCKLLSQKDAEGHESISSDTDLSSGSESENRPFHHPFQLKDRNAPIVLNIRNSVALPVKSLQEKTVEQARELRLQFPVSSGQHHRKTESEWVPVTTKRAEPLAITAPPSPPLPAPPVRRKRTFTDTPDPPMIEWRETRRETLETIGQFTGSTGVRVLTQAELAAGQQAWARRDQLQVAAPVNSGMGMALLQKMGWRPGEGLGKNKEGALQPLLLEVKTDKKGLVAQEELPVRQPHQIIRRTQRSLEGKHPVSLLNEYCSRRKYSPPCFELIDEAGPDHKKNFRFKVKVNGVEYTPAVGSPKKKQARAEAAEVCLKELGILPMMK